MSIDDLCIWKQSQLNQGTTFQNPNQELMKCYTCTGKKYYAKMIGCETFQPPLEQPVKQKSGPINYRRFSQSPFLYSWQLRGMLR